MIGQINLLNKLNTYNVDTFPRSVILMGEKGSGKHELVRYINSNIIKFPLYDITDTISDEYLDKIYRNPNPALYLIDMSTMTEKAQNILLKFIEEPLSTAFIILLCESRNSVLNTVLNRCLVFELDSYSIDELAQFTAHPEDISNDYKELIIDVLRTPGKVKSVDFDKLIDLNQLCNNMVKKMVTASFANTLTIVNKINYKDEYNKFDINLFFDMLAYRYYKEYLLNGNNKCYENYLYTIESRKKLSDKRLNKELFMVNFITKLWKGSKL